MMLWRLVSTSPTTKRFCVLFFVWNFVLIIVMIMKFNWFFLPMENVPILSTYLPPKLILQPTVFSGNTNTHLVLNASLKFCLNLKFTQPNFFLSKTHYWFTTTNFDLISWSSFTKVLIAVLLKCCQLNSILDHINLQNKTSVEDKSNLGFGSYLIQIGKVENTGFVAHWSDFFFFQSYWKTSNPYEKNQSSLPTNHPTKPPKPQFLMSWFAPGLMVSQLLKLMIVGSTVLLD